MSATPADLAALHGACFTMPRPWGEAEFADFLASKFCFLETLGEGALKGFVLGRVIAGEAELLTICTAPEARRQGLGRALLARFEAAARARGAETAFLEVAETNAPARAAYAAAGWVESGRRRGYYHAPSGAAVDALLLRREIAPPSV